MRRFLATAVLLAAAVGPLASGCASTIPNTSLEDTDWNRQVVAFMEQYRKAVESRDVGRLLSLASPEYLDDNGTPYGDDDLDYTKLREKLAAWKDRVKDVRYDIKYQRIHEEGDKILVEFRYAASFEVVDANGKDQWAHRVGDQRMVLTYNPTTHASHVLSGM